MECSGGIRFENLTGDQEIPYYYDDKVGAWLSLDETVVEFGRVTLNYNGFMRVAGSQFTTTHGFEIPFDAKSTRVSFCGRDTASVSASVKLRMYNNGVNNIDIDWLEHTSITLDVDIDAGQIGFRTFSASGGATFPDYPSVRAGMRWRLP